MNDKILSPSGIVPVNLENIPEELKSFKQWVAWKSQAGHSGNSKFSKIPVNPKTGGNSATDKPDTWGTFEEASEHYSWNKEDGIDGIGFVFTKDGPFCGVDLDNCRDPETGEIDDWAMNILNQLNSYCEISPSGTGIKVFAMGILPGPGRNFGNIEIYDTGRYFTLTGEVFDEYPRSIEERKLEIEALYKRYAEKSNKTIPQSKGSPEMKGIDIDSLTLPLGTKKLIKEGEPEGKRSEAIMSVINSMIGARMADSDIFFVFEHYPIGEKYREKGASKTQWLNSQIEKAKKFVTVKPGDKDNDSNEESLAFPFEIMSGAAGNYAELYGSHLETPKEFLFMSYLTCLGSVLSKRLTVATEITPQPRLYTILLGQSADERKSTALSKTTELFKEAVPNFDVCWGVGSAEGLQKRIEQVTDGLLLCLDEFKLFVSKCQITSSVLLPCVNTLYESNRYESRTKTTDISLEGACLSLLAASTVQTWERTWDASFTDIGFTNRLFIVPGTAKRKHSLPDKIPVSDKFALKSKINDVLQLIGVFKELDIIPKAKEIYHDWYMNIEGSIHAKRLDTYALRLMSLLAVNDLKDEIDVETVSQVIKLCDWQLAVRKIHDPIDADNKIAKMEEKIRRELSKGLRKEYELKQNVNANRAGLWAFDTAKKNLERAKEMAWDKKSKMWKLLL